MLRYDFADISDNSVELMADVAAFGTEAMMRDIIPHTQLHIEALIHAAASQGNIENLVSLLSSCHAHSHSLQDSTLLEAATSGQRHVVLYLLDRRTVIPTTPLPPGTSAHDVFSHALRNAASNGHLNIVQDLFTRGIAPTQDAIAAAASHDHTTCFQFLVRTLRETYKLPFDKVFPYITPAGIPHCTLSLLKRYPDPASLVQYIGDIARLGRVDVVKWLLGLVEVTGAGGRIALEAAAGAGQVDVLEVVLAMTRATQSDICSAVENAMDADHLGTTMRLVMEFENGPYHKD